MPLYGHELSEQLDPLTAGLSFAVNLKDRSFPGHDVLVEKKASPLPRKRVGLSMAGRRVPREGYAVKSGDRIVGEVEDYAVIIVSSNGEVEDYAVT